MSRYEVSNDTNALGVVRTRYVLGTAYAFVWQTPNRWEASSEYDLPTREAAVASEVAWLRQRAADMLALADAMETGRAADQVVDEDLDDCR